MKITWREIAHDYFGKSSSRLYHKLNGIDGLGLSPGETVNRRPGENRPQP